LSPPVLKQLSCRRVSFPNPPLRSASSALIIQAKGTCNTPGRNFIRPAQCDGLNYSRSRRSTRVRTDPIFSHPDKTPWCHGVSQFTRLCKAAGTSWSKDAPQLVYACALSFCSPLYRSKMAQMKVRRSALGNPSKRVPGSGECGRTQMDPCLVQAA
jgi:hypothetical protein